MSGSAVPPRYFVGWDVGGWNCDRNAKSRDAVLILDEPLRIVGGSWRGNLRDAINEADTTREFVGGLFKLCAAGPVQDGAPPSRFLRERCTLSPFIEDYSCVYEWARINRYTRPLLPRGIRLA